MPYMYGDQFSPYDNVHCSSFSEAAKQLRPGGYVWQQPRRNSHGRCQCGSWDFARLREAIQNRGGKIIYYRLPRMNETVSGHPDEWLPIRPGTDAALCAAIAHEWIVDRQGGQGVPRCLLPSASTRTPCPNPPRVRTSPTRITLWAPAGTWWRRRPEWAAPITQIPAAQHPRTCRRPWLPPRHPYITPGLGPAAPHQWRGRHAALFALLPVLLGKMGPSGHQHRGSAKAPWRSRVPRWRLCQQAKTPYTLSIPLLTSGLTPWTTATP